MLGWMSAQNKVAQRMMEQGGSYDGGTVSSASGMMVTAHVATALGWRAVGAIAEGDMVLTFDNGLQPVTRVTRHKLWSAEVPLAKDFWPLHVPAGAVGNRMAMDLLPHQYVMIESDAGEEIFGDAFSLIKAEALAGVNGIEAQAPHMNVEVIVLHFEAEQVIFDRSGVLYYCPSIMAFAPSETPTYVALSAEDADVLVACIECDRAAEKLCHSEMHPWGYAAA